MAAFTTPSEADLRSFLSAAGFGNYDEFQTVEAGSVNSNFSFFANGARWFLRIYEEQDERGAAAEQAMVATLARGGVPTPVGAARGTLAGKPAVVLPWVDGGMSCQRGVSPARARAVGVALGRIHDAGAGVTVPEGRFHVAALEKRLERIDASRYPVAQLGTALAEIGPAHDAALPRGLIHGDVFRDNVLWSGDAITAILDFESACRGAFVYDLAVTILAWCYGDALEAPLARAMVEGYAAERPLTDVEKRAFYTETRLAAVRFTITRITDYAMRGGEDRVMKDWRRFLARLDAVEAMGEAGLAELVR